MKILKIDNNQGYYTSDGAIHNVITEINRDDILKILKLICNNAIEMDECSSDEIITNNV